jgi:hypothetical protein
MDVEPHVIPRAGQWAVTHGARGYGTGYLIQHVREVVRRQVDGKRRFALRCIRVAPEDIVGDTNVLPSPSLGMAGVWTISWYPRRRTRRRLTA